MNGSQWSVFVMEALGCLHADVVFLSCSTFHSSGGLSEACPRSQHKIENICLARPAAKHGLS